MRHLRPALLWALFILVLCLIPGQALPAWHWGDLLAVDKLVHAFVFAVLFLLLLRGLERGGMARGKAILLTLLACTAYGALTELLQQIPVFGRRGSTADLIANTVGALLGWLALRWVLPRNGGAPSTGEA